MSLVLQISLGALSSLASECTRAASGSSTPLCPGELTDRVPFGLMRFARYLQDLGPGTAVDYGHAAALLRHDCGVGERQLHLLLQTLGFRI